MIIHVIQNVSYEGPGTLLDWAQSNDFKLRVSRTDLGTPLPKVHEFDFLVILGGATDLTIEPDKDNACQWISDVEQLILKTIKAKKKVLGICLGAQILARALGAKIYKNPTKEIGWYSIDSLKHASPFFSSKVIEWHENTFTIPQNAYPFGSSKACRNQGFVFQNIAMALQFHPEWNYEILESLIRKEGLPPQDQFVQSEDQLLSGDFESLKQEFCKLLNAFSGGLVSEFNDEIADNSIEEFVGGRHGMA